MRRKSSTGGLLSYTDWGRRDIKWLFGSSQVLLLVLLVLIGLGPVVWLAKGAITPTVDTLRNPLALFPHGAAWSNLSEAWTKVNVGRYFWNTVVLALGSWFCQIVVATTGAFVLSVLRPAWGRFVYALLLGTLFVPVVVLIVPLYIEVVHPPFIHHSFAESYWAIWLPAGASAFNVVLMKRFFDNLPPELFEAARIDGAGPVRLFCLDRVAPLEADPRSRLDLRDPRGVEELPLAVPGAHEQPGSPAALGTASGDPGPNATRRPARIDADRGARSHTGLSDLPALLPAWLRIRRRPQGLIADEFSTVGSSYGRQPPTERTKR